VGKVLEAGSRLEGIWCVIYWIMPLGLFSPADTVVTKLLKITFQFIEVIENKCHFFRLSN
jgi:hypothetical protein